MGIVIKLVRKRTKLKSEIGQMKIINMGIVIKLVRKRTKIEVGNWKNENSKYGGL